MPFLFYFSWHVWNWKSSLIYSSSEHTTELHFTGMNCTSELHPSNKAPLLLKAGHTLKFEDCSIRLTKPFWVYIIVRFKSVQEKEDRWISWQSVGLLEQFAEKPGRERSCNICSEIFVANKLKQNDWIMHYPFFKSYVLIFNSSSTSHFTKGQVLSVYSEKSAK